MGPCITVLDVEMLYVTSVGLLVPYIAVLYMAVLGLWWYCIYYMSVNVLCSRIGSYVCALMGSVVLSIAVLGLRVYVSLLGLVVPCIIVLDVVILYVVLMGLLCPIYRRWLFWV